MKKNIRIEILASSIPRLNAMSVESQYSIKSVLETRYKNVGISLVDNLYDLEKMLEKKPDIVVLGVKLILLEMDKTYEDSKKLWLPEYLTEKGIIFTGSETFSLKLEYDKPLAKQAIINEGLSSAPYFVSTIDNPVFSHNLIFPLFIKPTNRGDSKGIDENSIVFSQKEMISRIRYIHAECQSNALIEEYLPGREFSVSIISKKDTGKYTLMPIEIVPPKDKKGNLFLSESVKQADSEIVKAVEDPDLFNKLNSLALGVFLALGAQDYGRIDLRLDSEDNPHFVEANLMPGLSEHGYMSRCSSINKVQDYQTMIHSIIDLALLRRETNLKYKNYKTSKALS